MTAAPPPVRIAIVGAGDRGSTYAAWVADHPDRARVVAVAEPNAVRRERLADAHEVPAQHRYDDWHALLDGPRVADLVVVATRDREHRDPAVALAGAGYHLLLEKPMAPTEAECREITAAAHAAGVMVAVCHVLLYTPYTRVVRDVVRSGRIGRVMSVQHLEPVGWWHQAHSFVRGHWAREDDGAFMLLAKSCHDVDWLQHVVGEPAVAVSSFGSLQHFTAKDRPDRASDRCVTCDLQDTCPYSATRLYRGLLARGETGWPVSTVVDEVTPAALDEALATGPWGRCVYDCDNDVVDHQVVAIEYASGATASFTMTAFAEAGHRQTRIFGTHGEVRCDGETVEVVEFGGLPGDSRRETIDVGSLGDATAGGGHGGGDGGLMDAVVTAVATGDRSGVWSGIDVSLETHRTVFAAERARRLGTVERLDRLGAL